MTRLVHEIWQNGKIKAIRPKVNQDDWVGQNNCWLVGSEVRTNCSNFNILAIWLQLVIEKKFQVIEQCCRFSKKQRWKWLSHKFINTNEVHWELIPNPNMNFSLIRWMKRASTNETSWIYSNILVDMDGLNEYYDPSPHLQ